jgi:uncharacterized protein
LLGLRKNQLDPGSKICGFSKAKYYFLDNGIRNASIAQFNPLDSRSDEGILWENFLVMERLKKCTYQDLHGSFYFWRTYGGQEVDLVEEVKGVSPGLSLRGRNGRRKQSPRTGPSAIRALVLQP